MRNVEVVAIQVQAQPGASRDDALWDAMEIAFVNREMVRLTHNTAVYEVDPKAYFSHVIKYRDEPGKPT